MNLEPAWKTYLKISVGLIPTFFFWVFSVIIIFPKITQLSERAGFGINGSQAPTSALKTFIGLSRIVFFNFFYILPCIVVGLAILELWVRPWQRFRRPTLMTVSVLCNALLLLGLTVTVFVAVVAAEKFARGN